jgi:1-deoxy-D-xylulose-5-phosphate synthase
MAPKDKEELEDMLEFALKYNLPASIRYPRDESFSLIKKEKIVVGRAQILEEGKDVCIIALGSMVGEARKATYLLRKKGISVFLVNARFIKPLDEELLCFLASQFKAIMTLEEGVLEGGFGSSILEFYEKRNLLDKVNVRRKGIKDEFVTFAKREKLLKFYGLDGDSLYQEISTLLEKETLWQR